MAVTEIHGLIWGLPPNALEEWCERNHFGKVRERNMLGFGGSAPKYRTQQEQADAYGKAIVDVGMAPGEEA